MPLKLKDFAPGESCDAAAEPAIVNLRKLVLARLAARVVSASRRRRTEPWAGICAATLLLAAPAVSVALPTLEQTPHGPFTLSVDASDTARKIFWVSQTIPSPASGPLTLRYPQWESASHGPTIPAAALAGLVIKADGRVIPWRRDRIDAHALHIDVPAATGELSLVFQVVTSANEGLLQPDFVSVPWQRLVLYPADRPVSDISVSASVTLPEDLQPASSLALEPTARGAFVAAPVSLSVLIDSPVQAAPVVRTVEIGRIAGAPVRLNLLAEDEETATIEVEQMRALGRMIEQTQAVFGAPPFTHYEILARLEPDGSTGGTEHRSSTEVTLPANYFSAWDQQLNGRDIIPHELVHAWNGIYRKPDGQIAPTPNAPLNGELLWVYEGQTELWGRVLAARSGLRTLQETRDQLALDAAAVAGAIGRQWKSLDDDVNYPAFMIGRAVPWRDWQRRRDYYQEGLMLWLEVESELRAQSGGRAGLDDVAGDLFGDAPDTVSVASYTLDDLIEVLNTAAPMDWRTWLSNRVTGHGEIDPLSGLEALGWRLTYLDVQTETDCQNEAENGVTDLMWSIGLAADGSGRVRSVAWQGPAFVARLAPGARITRVADQPYSPSVLVDAVRHAADRPVVLTVEQDGESDTRTLTYAGTLRYPHLQRIDGRPDRLADLLAPR